MDSAVAFILGSFLIAGILILLWYVLQAIARWKIFTKAGEDGWKSLIPFYSTYIQYKISWNTNVFWVWLVLFLVSCVFVSLGSDKSTMIQILSSFVDIATFVITLFSMHKLSKAFGHGIGFTLGLFFFNPIFQLILGLGSSEYQGPQ